MIKDNETFREGGGMDAGFDFLGNRTWTSLKAGAA